MGAGSGQHAELAGELVEWWEDLWQRGMTSRVVLVAAPPAWGRTTVLDRLAEAAGADDAPAATADARRAARGQTGRLRIGFMASALLEFLPCCATSPRITPTSGSTWRRCPAPGQAAR
jgi:hypothetical protein